MAILELNLLIEVKRARLIRMVCKYGRLDPRVIAFSQRLDKLIVQAQKEMSK